jgi:hypothetical protein
MASAEFWNEFNSFQPKEILGENTKERIRKHKRKDQKTQILLVFVCIELSEP